MSSFKSSTYSRAAAGMPQCSARAAFHRIAAGFVCLVVVISGLALGAPAAQAASGEVANEANSRWQAEGTVNTVLTVANTLYIGGDFSALYTESGERVARNNLAAIDLVTGEPTSFDPNLNDKVWALTAPADNRTLYVGGAFTTVDGTVRKRIAAFDTASGALTSFNPPAPNSALRALALRSDRLYIGGLFEKVADEPRRYVAAYRLSTQQLDQDWKPAANDRVTSLIADSKKIWIGGDFSRIDGTRAPNLAVVTPWDGALIASEYPSYPVIALAAEDNRIFVAGGGPGGRAAAYDRTTGAELWTIASDGNFQAVDPGADYIYFGGHYEKVEGVPVGRVTRHDAATGELDTSWLPLVNGLRSINALSATNGTVAIGGDFTFVARNRHRGFAIFERVTVPSTPRANMVGLSMHDLDSNGHIDAVRVRFDRTLADCPSDCTSGWQLIGAPAGTSIDSVRVDKRTATLRLTEGTGEPDTAALGLRIDFRPSERSLYATGFRDGAPRDAAPPVPVSIYKTNVGTSGQAEPGDTFSVRFSEPVDAGSVPSSTAVVLTDRGNGSNDRLAIPGVIAGTANLRSAEYVACNVANCSSERVARFANSDVSLSNGGRTIVVTLGNCSGNCGKLAVGPTTDFVYNPAQSITDEDGNAVTTTMVMKTLKLF